MARPEVVRLLCPWVILGIQYWVLLFCNAFLLVYALSDCYLCCFVQEHSKGHSANSSSGMTQQGFAFVPPIVHNGQRLQIESREAEILRARYTREVIADLLICFRTKPGRSDPVLLWLSACVKLSKNTVRCSLSGVLSRN